MSFMGLNLRILHSGHDGAGWPHAQEERRGIQEEIVERDVQREEGKVRLE